MTTQSTDTPLTIGRRLQLVGELAELGKFDPAVLDAIGAVPRHLFVERGLEDFAYKNVPVTIGNGQTISQPSTVALQTQLLAPKPGEKILEIGTGCGYQSAILRYLGVRLYTIERQRDLCLLAQENLSRIGYTDIRMKWGDGFEGMPEFAPFDGIIVTCGAPHVPETLLRQLGTGARLVIPVNIAGEKKQQLQVIIRKNETDFELRQFGLVDFVPMLQGTEDLRTSATILRERKDYDNS